MKKGGQGLFPARQPQRAPRCPAGVLHEKVARLSSRQLRGIHPKGREGHLSAGPVRPPPVTALGSWPGTRVDARLTQHEPERFLEVDLWCEG